MDRVGESSFLGSATIESRLIQLERQIIPAEVNLTTIEDNITILQGNVTTLQGEIDAIVPVDIAPLEANITILQGNVTTLEGGNFDSITTGRLSFNDGSNTYLDANEETYKLPNGGDVITSHFYAEEISAG